MENLFYLWGQDGYFDTILVCLSPCLLTGLSFVLRVEEGPLQLLVISCNRQRRKHSHEEYGLRDEVIMVQIPYSNPYRSPLKEP